MALLNKELSPHILVVNCGSSSIKVSLFKVAEIGIKRGEQILIATLNGWGHQHPFLDIKGLRDRDKNVKEEIEESQAKGIKEALSTVLKILEEKYSLKTVPLAAIGHRFVHGGNRYVATERLTKEVIDDLASLHFLAPLHNPACLEGIHTTIQFFGNEIPQFASFDTAFSATLPPYAQLYAIPHELSVKYNIRHYGFHGLAHASLCNAYRHHTVQVTESSKIITLHLGNGCSASAIKDGVCIDTSMGFTPAEGLVMATRAGDIDAAILPFLCSHENKSIEEVMDLLNHKSGLLGISGVSSSMQELIKCAESNALAKLAIDVFCYRVRKYVGAYIGILGGVEAIIFSGGIGENSSLVRERIIFGLEWYGAKLDPNNNQRTANLSPGELHKISASDSSVEVYVIAADENAYIVQQILIGDVQWVDE